MEGGGESRKVFPLGKVVGSPTLEGGFMEEVSAFINQWTGVAVLCCHEKVVLIFLFLIDKFLSLWVHITKNSYAFQSSISNEM